MRLIVLLLALLPTVALAQSVDYFPLGEGDSWTYGFVVDPPFAPPDTILSDPVTVRGTTTVRDTAYTLVSLPLLWSDTLRTDAKGRVWARIAGRDQLYLDVTRGHEETYEIERDPDMIYTVTVHRNQTVATPAGRFENVVHFGFDIPGTVDAGESIMLAPGIGLVQRFGPFTDYRELFEARVGGTIILDDEALPKTADLRAFPNPFASSLTVELPRGDWTRLELVDALGRRMAALQTAPCIRSSCRLTWGDTDVPSGIYTIRATGPSGTAHQRVVRAR